MTKSLLGTFLVLMIALLQLMADAPKHTVTIEDLLSLKIPSAPQISPDGRQIAFVLTEPDFKESKFHSHIHVVSVDHGAPRAFTNGVDNESVPRWSPDGKWLAFLSQRKTKAAGKDEDDDEDDAKDKPKQVWIIPSDGGEAQKLTDADEGIMSYEWMPDSRAIVYLAKEPHPKPVKEIKKKDKKIKIDSVIEDEEKFRKQIWIIDLDKKKARKVIDGDYGIAEIKVSPDGKTVAYATNYTGKEDDEKKFDIWAASMADGRAWQITKRPGGERQPRWSPDGRSIAFVATVDPNVNYSQHDIFIVPADGGEPRNVTADFDHAVSSITWPAKGHDIYFSADARTYNHLFKVDPTNGKVEQITHGDKVFGSFDVASNGNQLVSTVEDAVSSPDVWISTSGAGDGKVLTQLNPQVAKFKQGRQEVIRWKSVDGWEIEGILVTPPDYQPGRKYPFLVAIHGGPYGRTLNTLRQYYNLQVWTAQGYAVLAPNYRGSAGYGNKFGIANRGDLGGKDYRDIMAGVDHVIGLGIADPERMGVFGGSYGGYMTNWIITQTNRFKAAVSMFGIFNLITDFSNSYLPSWEPDYLVDYYWENMDIYVKRSPFYYVKNITTPVLILHGEEDPNTFISNSKEMYRALRTLGKTVEFVRYPREEHGLREPNHRIDEMRRTLLWFDKYLKSPMPGQPAEFAVRQPVTQGQWELTIVSADTVSEYVGQTPKGIFLEVILTVKNKTDVPEPFTLHINDTQVRDVRLVGESGTEIYPVGIPTNVLGERVLIAGLGQSVSVAPDKEGKPMMVPLTLTFDVPKGARPFKLRVKDFPPISINVRASED
jgi:dipeptidyl aminopeptidase/acylaminoacyl peptidase